jgi:glycosyltransferase involved in cell wall biosynthesis
VAPCQVRPLFVRPPAPVTRVGVVVPAKDEQLLLPACLQSIAVAAQQTSVPVHVVVVLDDCRDASADVVLAHAAALRAWGPMTLSALSVNASNVGAARAAGAQHLLDTWGNAGMWLASTDADCVVPRRWLARQLAYAARGASAVLGTVAVGDWDGRSAAVRRAAVLAYGTGAHRHVHGANLAVSAPAYRRADGFPPLRAHEDVALVQRLLGNLEPIVWASDIAVRTSGRRAARVNEGFAGYLNDLEHELA